MKDTKNSAEDPFIERSMRVLNFIIEDTGMENANKFAESLGFKRPERLYKVLRGENRISKSLARIIHEKHPKYSERDILTGELLSETKEVNEIKVTEPLTYFNTKAGSQYEELPSGKYRVTVPFVPVRAQATYVSEHVDAEYMASLSPVSFIVDRVGNGKYVAFEVQNDSMNDGTINSIPDGTIVLARELGRQHWKSKFRTSQYPNWIIVHKNSVLCKEIINHDVEQGIITCHSLNDSPEYPDFDLHLDDVRQLFNIIKRQLP